MYLALLTLTLFSGLTLARRIAEPSCPGCAAKSWNDEPRHLECARCGWTTRTTTIVDPAQQYEMGLASDR